MKTPDTHITPDLLARLVSRLSAHFGERVELYVENEMRILCGSPVFRQRVGFITPAVLSAYEDGSVQPVFGRSSIGADMAALNLVETLQGKDGEDEILVLSPDPTKPAEKKFFLPFGFVLAPAAA